MFVLKEIKQLMFGSGTAK